MESFQTYTTITISYNYSTHIKTKVMELLKESGHTCCKKIVDKTYSSMGYTESWVCGKPAIYKHGSSHFCRHHSGIQRYVIRIGDTGSILSRYDTEDQARAAFKALDMTGIRIQRLTGSKRRDLLDAFK